MDAGIQTTEPEEIPFNARGANSIRHFAYNNPWFWEILVEF